MNMKVMSRMAIGGLCLAAASFGIGRCTSNSGTKNVDNILTEDIVELSEPSEELSEGPALVSYEYNQKLDERLKGYYHGQKKIGNYTAQEDAYKDYGTYGASIYLQETKNPTLATTTLIQYKNKKYENYRNNRHNQLIDERAVERRTNPDYKGDPELQEYEWINNMINEIGIAEQNIRDEMLEEMKSELFSNDVPNAISCLLYQKFALAEAGLTEEELTELETDLDNFSKAQGKETTQTQAEYLAYMQFKRDSITSAHLLKETGFWKEPLVRRLFKEMVATTVYRPKP